MILADNLMINLLTIEESLIVTTLILVLITFFEVLIIFKAKSLLKSIFLVLLFSIGMYVSARILFLFGYTNRTLLQVPQTLIFLSILYLLSFLNQYKVSRKIVIISLLILGINFSLLAYYRWILDLPSDVIVANITEFSNYIYFFRFFLSLFIVIISLNYIQKIYRKYPSGNLYFRRLRTWSISFPIILVIILCCNAAYFHDEYHFIRLFTLFFCFGSLILLILFRPRFLNHLSLELSLKNSSANFQSSISDSDFMDCFFGKAYFLNPLASLEDMANEFGISGTELYNYIYSRYTLSFNDLLNKHRVEYFVDLVQTRKYPHYTIDALAQLCGFSSRHHLYKPFQKFHGGTPSSFMNSIS